jgi:hypothetical protein
VPHGLQRSWNHPADDFERQVPFTDPAQVSYLARLSRDVARSKDRQHNRDVTIDEIVSAVNVLMGFLDGITRDVVVNENGKKVVKILQFLEKPILKTETRDALLKAGT